MHCRYSDLAADTTRTFSTHFLESFACRTRNCINKQFSITPEDHCTLLNNSYYCKVHQSGNVIKITALTRTDIRESSLFGLAEVFRNRSKRYFMTNLSSF